MAESTLDKSTPPANPSHRRRVLLVGDFRHRDFAAAVDWLQANAQLCRVESIAEALASLAGAGLPEVVLFAQSRPGQFSHRDVERIHARCPLSRLVVLLGSWCEGETRTGRPWPGVIRIFWHQWRCRLVSELAAGGAPWPTWHLPRTASAGEQLACAAAGAWPRGQGLVVIHARLFGEYQALCDACAAGGYAGLWDPSVVPAFSSPASAALYSAIGGDPDEAVALAELVRRHKPAPVIALLDFVRRDDHDRAMDAGAAAVLAKPFLVSDLLWNLDVHIRNSQANRAA